LDVFEAIKDRRSVKAFTREQVSDEEIEKLIEAARWAPSAGNIQRARLSLSAPTCCCLLKPTGQEMSTSTAYKTPLLPHKTCCFQLMPWG
jgi:nitroreductase